MALFVWLLLIVVLRTATPSCGVQVATIPCNGTIPIDSQYNLDPAWSLASFRNSVVHLSGGAMTLSHQVIEKNVESFLVSETGLDVGSLTLFEVSPTASSTSDPSGSLTETAVCSAVVDPLLGGMDGMTSKSARFTILRASDANGAVCTFPLAVTLVSGDRKASTTILVQSSTSQFTESVGFGVVERSTWPLQVSFSSQCTLQFILVLNRYGAINRWYAWIPTTVYTAVVVAVFLPVVALRRRLPVHLAGLFLFVVFLGFLGSSIGLVLELLQWQSALGRMFPFPPSVTLYCCLCLLYVLLLFPVLFRQGNNTVLLMGAARLLTYGLNCALCVGYWVAGYVVLGSLSVLQLLVTNFILSWYYAYVSVHLRRAVRGTTSLPKFSNNFLYLWCVPVTPFACCALMYYDLYLLVQRDIKGGVGALRMRDVVRVYNAQMSIPLLIFQNIWGTALLATATAFHMPFVVLLFVALLLWVLHVVYAVDQYCREWSRWRRLGASLDACGCLSLAVIMKRLLANAVPVGATSSPAPHVVSQAMTPSPQSVRRRVNQGQYEADIAAYRDSQPTSSTTSDDDSYDGPSQRMTRRQLHDQSAAFSTPSRQHISDAPEYWPSSVER